MNRIITGASKLLPQNAFARGVSVLVSGAVGSQVLMVLAAPLLTRLYTPENFGLLGVFAALLAILGVVSCLRYEIAIPLPQSDVEAANLVMLSMASLMVVTAFSIVIVWGLATPIVDALGVPELDGYLWLLPIGIFLAGTYRVLSYWAVRTKSFSAISKTRISQVLATLSVQIIGSKFGGLALLFGQAAGQGAGSVGLARSSFKAQPPSGWSWTGIVDSARRYKQFPIFSTWSGLFNTGGTQLPPLILATLFGAGPAGLYALAHRILAMPMSVVGDAVGKVFFSRAADALRDSKLDELVLTAFTSLVKVSFPAAIAFMLIAPELFAFAFGENWRMAGELACWMTPWLVFQFVSSPLSTVYFVLEKENYGLGFQVFLLLARVGSLIIGSVYFDFIGTVIAFSLGSAVCYILYVFSIFCLSKVKLTSFFLVLGREAIFSSFVFIPAIYLSGLGFGAAALILIVISLSVVYWIRLKAFYKP